MVNKHHTVFYVGVTSDLYGRTTRHKEKFYPKGFTAQYNVDKLVYYELFGTIQEAIAREKQIKAYSRVKKVLLVVNMNPEWKDLFDEVRYL